MTFGKLITAVYASVFCLYSCTRLSGRLEYNSLFVGPGGWNGRGSEQRIWLSRRWAQCLEWEVEVLLG